MFIVVFLTEFTSPYSLYICILAKIKVVSKYTHQQNNINHTRNILYFKINTNVKYTYIVTVSFLVENVA